MPPSPSPKPEPIPVPRDVAMKEAAKQAQRDYELECELLNKAGLSKIERQAALSHAKQKYLRRLKQALE